ncbi:hypothetical protein FDP41_001705 [Naegleria fowleri]|uniref:SAM domain-containing protein n=1 Tax=Naegleria fowleri TaxID=5763 RepID=A0A6A5BXJ7_NAEFO|nr:uncharacterized protein FDP41_001705 [Naegleria fowleri]KAF0979362.1 hypothetical protein FDP41_001705 [Naegleria fowleri]
MSHSPLKNRDASDGSLPRPITSPRTSPLSTGFSLNESNTHSLESLESMIVEDIPKHLQTFEEELRSLESFLHVQIKNESFRDFSQSEQLYALVQKIKPSKEQLKELKRNYRQSISASRIQGYIEDLVTNEDGKQYNLCDVNKLLNWKVEDVVQWLQNSGLSELEPLIRRKKIDGERLIRLEDDISMINIQDLELRKRFEYEVDELLVSHGFDPLPETDYPELMSRKRNEENAQRNQVDLSKETFMIQCVLKSTNECKELEFQFKQLVNYFSLLRVIKTAFQMSEKEHVEISVGNAESCINLSPSNILKVFKKDLLAAVRDLVCLRNSASTAPSPRNMCEKKFVINIS